MPNTLCQIPLELQSLQIKMQAKYISSHLEKGVLKGVLRTSEGCATPGDVTLAGFEYAGSSFCQVLGHISDGIGHHQPTPCRTPAKRPGVI